MLWLVLVVVALFVVWKFRVPLLAKVLGQSQDRVARQLKSRRR